MKLLRSTFVAFYITCNTASSFYVPSTTNSITKPKDFFTTTTTTLQDGFLHEQEKKYSEEEVQKELAYQAVLTEVKTAKEYLTWIVEGSHTGEELEDDDGTPLVTFEDVLKKKAEEVKNPTTADVGAGDATSTDIGLFGGTTDESDTSTPPERETTYQPALRTNLGSTILLTGSAIDSTLLNILNNNKFGETNVSNFDFTTIKALVDDVAAVKKDAISRKARYSGLLNKLVIEPTSKVEPGVTKEDLTDVSCWILQTTIGESDKVLSNVAELAKGCETLKNVVVLVEGVTDMSSVPGWDSLLAASSEGEAFQATLLAVGELYGGGNEGGYYHVGPLESIAAKSATEGTSPKMSKKMAYQLLAHSLSLESTASQALMAYEYSPAALDVIGGPYAEEKFAVRDDDDNNLPDEYKTVKMESRIIRAARESGFTQWMELDVLVSNGVENYRKYLANPPARAQSAWASQRSERDLEDEKVMAILDADDAKFEAKKKALDEKERQSKVDSIAQEWALKEFTLKRMGGDLESSMSETEYIASVWETALVEAEKAYEYINSDEYAKVLKRNDFETRAQDSDRLFWPGMDEGERKRREKLVEKLKKQYMDILSEEDLEKIIMSG